MNHHLERITTDAKKIADAFERLGVVPDAVLDLREAEAEAKFYQVAKDQNSSRDEIRLAFLMWMSALLDRVLR